MNERRGIAGQLLRYGPLAAIAGVLVWHALQYAFVTDDAFISFVYSRNLAHHGSLVFNLGDRVEGYTNFLWTFVLGLLMVVHIPPEIASQVLGLGFGIATLWVTFRIVEHCAGTGEPRRTPFAYVTPLLLALTAGYACWSSGGLETQMFTFFVASAFLEYARADGDHRRFRRLGVYLALAAMTRPEGMLVTGVLGLHRLGLNLIRDRRLRPTTDEIRGVSNFLMLFVPYFAWRWWYYGYPFPNTYYVKASGAIQFHGDFAAAMWKAGFYYLHQWAVQTRILWALPLAVVGLVVARPRTARFAMGTAAALLSVAYLGYTAKVGGDFMGLHRFIMPITVLVAVGVGLGLAVVAGWLRDRLARADYAVAAVAAALVVAFAVSQYHLTVRSLTWGNFASDHGIDTPAFLSVYTHDRAVVGMHMKDCFLDDDFAVFGGVGAQPYYSQVDGIDAFGLVSWDVAHCQPRTNARAGHDKWGEDGLLKKQPRRDGHVCPPEHDHRYDWSKVHGGPPTFWFARYAFSKGPVPSAGDWQGRAPAGNDYTQVTLHIGCTDSIHHDHPPGWKPASPEPLQNGTFYTFYIRKERLKTFQCKGLVERSR